MWNHSEVRLCGSTFDPESYNSEFSTFRHFSTKRTRLPNTPGLFSRILKITWADFCWFFFLQLYLSSSTSLQYKDKEQRNVNAWCCTQMQVFMFVSLSLPARNLQGFSFSFSNLLLCFWNVFPSFILNILNSAFPPHKNKLKSVLS